MTIYIKNELNEILSNGMKSMKHGDFRDCFEEGEDLLFLALIKNIQSKNKNVELISYNIYDSYIIDDDTNAYLGLFKVLFKDVEFVIFTSNEITENGYTKPVLHDVLSKDEVIAIGENKLKEEREKTLYQLGFMQISKSYYQLGFMQISKSYILV